MGMHKFYTYETTRVHACARWYIPAFIDGALLDDVTNIFMVGSVF